MNQESTLNDTPVDSSPFNFLVQQLHARGGKQERAARFNPRPPGVIREGSATHAVLEFLRSRPRMFFTHGQIVDATGRTEKSVCWGLLYLRTQGLIDSLEDATRCSRYLKYRLAQSTAKAPIK